MDTEPSWTHEPIVIAPPDPTWPTQAAKEAEAVTGVLSRWLTGGVHHVGSTSVPGMCAKPVLDLMAGVLGPEWCTGADAPLAANGWHYVTIAYDGKSWRRFYVKPRGGHRWAHLHLVATGGPQWDDFLQFRAKLIADPSLRSKYANLKKDLAERHGQQREAYTEAKAAFILSVLRGQPTP